MRPRFVRRVTALRERVSPRTTRRVAVGATGMITAFTGRRALQDGRGGMSRGRNGFAALLSLLAFAVLVAPAVKRMFGIDRGWDDPSIHQNPEPGDAVESVRIVNQPADGQDAARGAVPAAREPSDGTAAG